MTGRKIHLKVFLITKSLFVVFFIFVLFVLCSSLASSSNISEEFSSTSSYKPGTIVSLSREIPGDIIIANINNSDDFVGIVTEESDATVTYARDNATISVARSGLTTMFVTDANGLIKTGDNIVVSWVQGIGMLPTPGESKRIVAVALEDFNSGEAKVYASTQGENKKEISIVGIAVRIVDVAVYQENSEQERAGLVGFLSDMAGKDVSYIRSVLSLVIFVVSMLVTVIYLTVSLRSSFISIGRNPLAGSIIFKGLTRITILSVVIVTIGTTLAYVVLVG